MDIWIIISIAVYIVGIIVGYIYEGWKNGFGNTKDDNYAIPLLWPLPVAFFALVFAIGLPLLVVVFGFKFICDGFILLGDCLHTCAKKRSESKMLPDKGKKNEWIWKK